MKRLFLLLVLSALIGHATAATVTVTPAANTELTGRTLDRVAIKRGNVTALMARGSSTVKPFGGANGNTTAGYSFVIQMPGEGPFVAIQPTFNNYDTASSYVISGMKCAAVPTAGHTGTTGVTWVTITFGGATTGTVPIAVQGLVAGAADRIPGMLTADIAYISSVARTDLPGNKPLLNCRTYHAGVANSETIGNLTGIGAANTLWSGIRDFGSAIVFADAVTTPTGVSFPPTTGVTFFHPNTIKFYYQGSRGITVAGLADSLYDGYVATGGVLGPIHRAAYSMSTSTRRVTPLVYSTTGQHHDATYQTAIRVIDAHKPDVMLLSAWSPNDALSTQAVADKSWAELLDIIDRCRAAGIIPVPTTQGPINSAGAGETIRQAQNVRVLALRNLGIAVVDLDAVYRDPSNPSNILPAYDSGDHLHYNDAGYAAGAAAIRAVLETLFDDGATLSDRFIPESLRDAVAANDARYAPEKAAA